jgi:hypothetical protein
MPNNATLNISFDATLDAAITQADATHYAALIPASGHELLHLLGLDAGVKLINALRGVQLVVPRGPCNNDAGAQAWRFLVAIVGEPATLALSKAYAGRPLNVPRLEELRRERRNTALRGDFDRLTARAPEGSALSKTRAVQQLALKYQLTWRGVELVIDRPSGMDNPIPPQLF